MIGRAKRTLQPGKILTHRVQQAAIPLQLRAPHGRVAALAKQPFEDDAGIGLHRKRHRRRAPGQRIDVGTAVAPLAVADHEVGFERQLERRQRRFLPELPGGVLINRRPRLNIGPLSTPGAHAAQPATAHP